MSMPMLLIRGTFRAKGTKPDGDTLSFTPDDVTDWKRVPGPRPVVPGSFGQASIRLESIDALETHYGDKNSPSGVQHQPLELAHAAADALLKAVGFTDFHRAGTGTGDEAEKITSTIPETVPGWILTRGADVFGRCVALVGTGLPPAFNGYEVDVDGKELEKTVNYQLVKDGLVYPTYYSGFSEVLRASLTAAATAAREAQKGVWKEDRTLRGAEVVALSSLTGDKGAVVLPKLFRRLKDYLDLEPRNPSLACFRAYLAGAWEDRFYIQGKPGVFNGMHHIVEVDGQVVKMTHGPMEIVFVEK
ncbi:thermonuclease family protein [Streptomyces sp. NPDC047976]|uniref:thermonuclease family protein n=1 Tax=unclassified Streptomyces TaxID=2593676 RepID=UPI0034291A47